jgi:hypothetical protein
MAKIEIVWRQKPAWFGRTKIHYAIRRVEDDRYKDLVDKPFSHSYWWVASTSFGIWTQDYDLVQDVFAFLTGEKAAHDYEILKTGEVK